MADEGKVCVCPQCGKKYKLKEGFDAKSFSCKACGAAVWVAGKPPAPAPTSARGAGPSPAVGRKGGRGGRAASADRHSRHGHGAHGEGGRRGRGHEQPKSNKSVLIAVAAVAVVGIVIVVAVASGKDNSQQPVAQQPAAGGPGLAAAGTGTPASTPPAATGAQAPPANAGAANPTGAPGAVGPETPKAAETPDTEPAPSPEGGESEKPKLGGATKKEKTKSKYDPPATLGHLETTPPELRKQIDDWIVMMLDTQAGRDSLEAKTKLAATGKPAFQPILGAMAKIRDNIADTDSMEERLIESSLKLADECLREMDGYLEAHDKAPIRPGTEKNYIEYVLRIHYRRWMEGMGSTPLKDMETMPGPFDASKVADEGGDEEEEAGK